MGGALLQHFSPAQGLSQALISLLFSLLSNRQLLPTVKKERKKEKNLASTSTVPKIEVIVSPNRPQNPLSMKPTGSSQTVTLPSGSVMPLNGFGTWKAPLSETTAAVKAALEVGYRHIDCAAVYMNETAVGEALGAFLADGHARDQLFVTSKVWNSCHARDKVVEACKQSIRDLRVGYLDLYLVHHPFAWEFGGLPIGEGNWMLRDGDGSIRWGKGVSLEDTWRGMEDCVRMGLVKNIGVSNYSVTLLMDLLQYCEIRPAVNQCEAHVYNTREELKSVCTQFGIHFTMYSILGSGKEGPLGDATVHRIAKDKGATAAQVLIAWGLAKECSVLAKSSKAKRVRENFGGGAVLLSEEEVKELDGLDRELRVCNMIEYWGFPSHA